MTRPVSYLNTNITGGFWKNRQDINRKTSVFAVRDRFEDTGRFEAFKFNWTEDGDEPTPHIFWDSDVAKWLESCAYIIAKAPDKELEDKVEQVIDLIEKNQCEDGYFNIYFTVCEPELRFTNRDCHELYCAGHLAEAAVAYYEATGKDRFLRLMEKYMDYIERVFVEEKSAEFTSPGHEEIELALVRMYRTTGKKKFLDLAKHFIDVRGTDEESPLTAWANSRYNQSHLPVRQQRTAEGHAVRACYLYCGMADVAAETRDKALLEACKALFDNITRRRMYITGGIGSSSNGEAFTVDYDLPNSVAYAETCAAISLALFAYRMEDLEHCSKYADIIEKVLYNGFLSGISLDGKAFFYENPLEILWAERKRNVSINNAKEHFPITRRKEVFDCSCCPPNVTRFIASLGGLLYSNGDEGIYVHQYAESTAEFDGIKITQKTDYPNSGEIELTVDGAKGKNIRVRIPSWCRKYSLTADAVNENGYAKLYVPSDSFVFTLSLEMEPYLAAVNQSVFADCGRYALMRGPLVYCAEGMDNGENLRDIRVSKALNCTQEYVPACGTYVLNVPGFRTKPTDALYTDIADEEKIPCSFRFIPYFAFANREETEMLVWVQAE